MNFNDTRTFLGLRNKAVSRRPPHGEGVISLAECQNIQIDTQGGISSRDQHSSVFTGSSITAGFSVESNQYGYLVDSGVLYRIEEDLSTTSLGSVSTQSTEWLEIGTSVFMSTGYLINNDTLLPWETPIPPQPTITITTGFLLAGQYQITTTTIMPDGRESGSCDVIALNINDGEGIALSDTTGRMVYMTERSGSVFYEAGIGTTLIEDVNQLSGKSINQSLLLSQTVPMGVEKIAYYNQCLYASIYDPEANSSAIYFSKPFSSMLSWVIVISS